MSNGSGILAFDMGGGGVIVNTHSLESDRVDSDINQIAMSADSKWIASIDDDGRVGLYSGQDLCLHSYLSGAHSNIGYSLDFLQQKTGPVVVSGGFDSCVRYWDVVKDKSKNIELGTLAQTYIQG